MSNRLLIYIREGQRFDRDLTERAIESIPGIVDVRRGELIGAVFYCGYLFEGETTIVRIADDLETIVASGLDRASLDFALQLQARVKVRLRMTDTDYSFELALSDFDSLEELDEAIRASD